MKTSVYVYWVTFLIFALATLLDFSHKWITTEKLNEKVKKLPAEIVLLTLPINIALTLEPSSFLCFFPEAKRLFALVILVLLSFFVYMVTFFGGQALHKKNSADPVGTGLTKFVLVAFYVVSFLFLALSGILSHISHT